MAYSIEVISLGDDSNSKIAEVAHSLNVVQEEFRFSLPPERLKDAGATFIRAEYSTAEVWAFLKDYRSSARGNRSYLIAVINSKLRSKRYENLFGSHEASEGLAVFTLHDHQQYADSYRPYLAYYLIRYALSFVCPELKSHQDSRGCFFDFKANKSDLKKSLESGGFCDEHQEKLAACFNAEIQRAIESMISAMRSLQAKSNADLDARVLKGHVDIGIITIKEEEFTAVLNQFPSGRHAEGQNRLYEYVVVQTKANEELRVAIGRSPEQGQGPASAIAHDMITDLAPQWIFLVGIAGGFPDSDFTLGDVLLSSRVHDFEVSAVLEEGSHSFQDQGGPAHRDVEKLLTFLPALKKEIGNWNEPEFLLATKPIEKVPKAISNPKFYGPEPWKKKVHTTLREHFTPRVPSRPPIAKVAPAIATSTLVKNVEWVKQWRDAARHAADVEMELGGVYRAARYGGDGNTRVLAIRGISDIVGYKRDPAWTNFACCSAAAFAAALIKSGRIRRAAKK